MPKAIRTHIEDFETIVWDWNGTILDDMDIVMRAEAEFFPLYNVKAPTRDERGSIFCFPIEEYYKKLGFDFSAKSFELINQEFLVVYAKLLAEARLFEGMKELLSDIHKSGKQQFALSAAPQSHLEEILVEHDIANYFHAIYGLPDTNAHSKISRGRDLLREQKIDPAKTLMIGDTKHDFEVAQALGFEALLIAEGHDPFEKLSLAHHRVLRTRY